MDFFPIICAYETYNLKFHVIFFLQFSPICRPLASAAWCSPYPLFSLAMPMIQIGLPFWCRLTEVVLEKRPLNSCLCLSSVMKADTCLDGAILRHDCLSEMHEVRKSLVQDFSINPLLVRDCSYEIEKHCGGRVQRAGRTIHCLMELARSVKTEDDTAAISPRCVRTVRGVVVVCANRVISWSHLILPVICCSRIQANLYLHT